MGVCHGHLRDDGWRGGRVRVREGEGKGIDYLGAVGIGDFEGAACREGDGDAVAGGDEGWWHCVYLELRSSWFN